MEKNKEITNIEKLSKQIYFFFVCVGRGEDGENIILLVEADKIEADRLRKRYKNFKNVKVYAQAIGEIVGYKNLRILKNPAMSGFFRRKKISPLFWDHSSNLKTHLVGMLVSMKTLSLNSIEQTLLLKDQFSSLIQNYQQIFSY